MLQIKKLNPYSNFLIKRHISKLSRNQLYKKCFLILGVSEDCDQNTVRKAYIELVKKFHPDSNTEDSSSERFYEVDEAFKILQGKFAKNRRGIIENEEEEVLDIRHKAPQHRQYLSYEGIGVGTPSQRLKQYQQHKVAQAQERVYNHRIGKAQAGEKDLIKKSSKGNFYSNHSIKTKYGFDRVVEDLILEAMSKGDFDNLSCAGKPLTSAQTQNPYLDYTTAKLNKILIDNGFIPEWIQYQRDIRQLISKIKQDLATERSYYGDLPFNDDEETSWKLVLAKYEDDVVQLNKLIDKYNLIVPIVENQFCRIKLEKLASEVLKDDKIMRNQKLQAKNNETLNGSAEYKKSDFFSFLGSLF